MPCKHSSTSLCAPAKQQEPKSMNDLFPHCVSDAGPQNHRASEFRKERNGDCLPVSEGLARDGRRKAVGHVVGTCAPGALKTREDVQRHSVACTAYQCQTSPRTPMQSQTPPAASTATARQRSLPPPYQCLRPAPPVPPPPWALQVPGALQALSTCFSKDFDFFLTVHERWRDSRGRNMNRIS